MYKYINICNVSCILTCRRFGSSYQEMHARSWTPLCLVAWWRQTQVLQVGVLQISGKQE